MAIRPQSERRFDRASPVGRYWLAQCEGFRVRGPLKGTVEEVVGSVDPQNAEALVVRNGIRRHTIPISAVHTVVPAARVVVLDAGSGVPSHAPARAVAGAGARAATTIGATVAANGPRAGRFVRDAVVAVASFFASALMTLVRGLLIVSRRAAADVRERRQHRADARRSSADATPPRQDRTLSRAAVLGVGRRGTRRP